MTRTAFEYGLVKEFSKNSIKRLWCHGVLAERALFFPLAEPLLDARLAKHVITLRALFRVKNQLRANVALKVFWAFTFGVDR